MKEFVLGLIALLAATIVSCIILPTGLVWGFLHSIYFSIKKQSIKYFFTQIWVTIDGFLAGIGHMFYHIAFGQDIIWNVVSGEMLEDAITHEEDTEFRNKIYPVSAAIGKVEIEGKLTTKTGKFLSRMLSIVFIQKQHAIDAWNWNVARNKLKEQYFEKR